MVREESGIKLDPSLSATCPSCMGAGSLYEAGIDDVKPCDYCHKLGHVTPEQAEDFITRETLILSFMDEDIV